jgi:hypothetical protein
MIFFMLFSFGDHFLYSGLNDLGPEWLWKVPPDECSYCNPKQCVQHTSSPYIAGNVCAGPIGLPPAAGPAVVMVGAGVVVPAPKPELLPKPPVAAGEGVLPKLLPLPRGCDPKLLVVGAEPNPLFVEPNPPEPVVVDPNPPFDDPPLMLLEPEPPGG